MCEVLRRREARIGSHRDGGGLVGHDGERRQLAWAERAAAEDVIGEQSLAHDADVMTVAGMLGHVRVRKRAAAAGLVQHVHALEPFRFTPDALHEPCGAVVAAAGRGQHDELDRLLGLPCRLRGRRHRSRDECSCQQQPCDIHASSIASAASTRKQP